MTDKCPPCEKPNPGQYMKLNPETLLLSMALDGIVVDPATAAKGPCECIKTTTGKNMCWDKGIVGALNQDQVKQYCTNNSVAKKLPSALQKRWETFATASEECEIGDSYATPDGMHKVQNLEDRLHCISQLASGGSR
jgi:hypothetical protein